MRHEIFWALDCSVPVWHKLGRLPPFYLPPSTATLDVVASLGNFVAKNPTASNHAIPSNVKTFFGFREGNSDFHHAFSLLQKLPINSYLPVDATVDYSCASFSSFRIQFLNNRKILLICWRDAIQVVGSFNCSYDFFHMWFQR